MYTYDVWVLIVTWFINMHTKDLTVTADTDEYNATLCKQNVAIENISMQKMTICK